MKKFLNLSKWGMIAPLLVIFAIVILLFTAIRASTNSKANGVSYFDAIKAEFKYFFQT